ncbi:hypothetical protein TIFTF001_033660 [Ficus carica]|uniref:FAR1 domain-containing protein n=1 Tax=Ficus carica TaxID=3494 RepID=A0AA88DYM1_FICCA|nr:hypothetical protein TIFTF001_033660 [Ficus carica]
MTRPPPQSLSMPPPRPLSMTQPQSLSMTWPPPQSLSMPPPRPLSMTQPQSLSMTWPPPQSLSMPPPPPLTYQESRARFPSPPPPTPPPPPHEVHTGGLNSTLTDQGQCSWDNAIMPESQSSTVPQRNMEFSSEEEAYKFYKNYAEQKGFKVRKGKVQRTLDGKVPHTSDGKAPINKRIFLCSKEGKRSKKVSENTPKYERKETRTGCKAEIRIELKNGKWVIYSCSLEHNHPLERPGQTHETDICPDNSQVVARESTGDGAHVEDKEGGKAENQGPEKEVRSKQEFEKRWNLLMKEYEREEGPWLANVYKLREKWSHMFSEELAFPADLDSLINLEVDFSIFPGWTRGIATLSDIFKQ